MASENQGMELCPETITILHAHNTCVHVHLSAKANRRHFLRIKAGKNKSTKAQARKHVETLVCQATNQGDINTSATPKTQKAMRVWPYIRRRARV